MNHEIEQDAIFEIIPRDKVAVPKIPFQKFYKKFKTVRQMTRHEDWKVYSQFYSFEDNELDIKIGEDLEEMEAYDEEKQMNEFIKCATSFSYFAHKYAKIIHPVYGLIPGIPYKYQKRVIKHFDTNRFNIISKFRQGGLTTMSVLWSLWRCMFKPDQQIMVLSKTDREALAAGDIAQNVMDYLPSWLKPKLSTDSKHEKMFADTTSSMRFYTPEAARGKSMTILIIDEAAFIKDMETHWKSMYPVIATGGACIVVSTVNGIGNWYERVYREAEAQENQFNVIDLDYWEHPDYCNPKWIKETRANLSEKGWAQEVLRSFLGSGETLIAPHILAELGARTRNNAPKRTLFGKWVNTQERKIDWEGGALWIWKEPRDGHEYIIAADCAEGVGEDGDNNCFEVIDEKTLEQIAEFYSNNIPPGAFSQVLQQIGIYYNTALIVVENNAIGSSVANNLEVGLHYENLYYDSSKKAKVGINTKGSNRPVIIEKLQHNLLNGRAKINSVRVSNELNTFLYNPRTKKAEAQRGKHDDAVMALSTAYYVRDQICHDLPIADSSLEENSIFNTQIYQEIREEILRDSPENYIEQEPTDIVALLNQEDVIPELMFGVRRSKDKLLKEFGW